MDKHELIDGSLVFVPENSVAIRITEAVQDSKTVRLGGLVLTVKSIPTDRDEVHIATINNECYLINPSVLQGIALTDERLLSMGFTRCVHTVNKKDFEYAFDFYTLAFVVKQGADYFFVDNNSLTGISKVHLLQKKVFDKTQHTPIANSIDFF